MTQPNRVDESSNQWLKKYFLLLCNRFDAVHVVPGPENGTFYARAMNLGEAILKVCTQLDCDIMDF